MATKAERLRLFLRFWWDARHDAWEDATDVVDSRRAIACGRFVPWSVVKYNLDLAPTSSTTTFLADHCEATRGD